ncbi:hypothetical protein, partial [Nostoc cycadae]|uniref:hypothetical protein n=1 Tax=Nostoc cycadae TaxID=246795 RepID=UPI0011AF4748
ASELNRLGADIRVKGNAAFVRGVPMLSGAVSYTHLDVYKRQLLSRVSSDFLLLSSNVPNR